jgi:hypothetical protein
MNTNRTHIKLLDWILINQRIAIHVKEGSKAGVVIRIWGLRHLEGLHGLVLKLLHAGPKSAGDGGMGNLEGGHSRLPDAGSCRKRSTARFLTNSLKMGLSFYQTPAEMIKDL